MFKFKEVMKSPLWGGKDIVALKHIEGVDTIGESWEVIGVPGDETPVVGGEYDGWTLRQLIEKFGADFVGKKNFEVNGTNFPLLIKFISADDALSIQVHPDDAMAQRVAGKPFGKTEMWYLVGAHPGATLYSGFNRDLTVEEYDKVMAENRLEDVMARYETKVGDCFFIPAGQIHSIGKGNLIIEVQQSSDLTYRVYDFNRRDAQGNLRQLHTAEAREALNFKSKADYRTHYEDRENCRVQLESCPQFTTSVYHLTEPLRADYADVDSFAILICYEGQAELTDSEGNTTTLKAGETVLFPATNKWVDIRPLGEGRFSCVETYTLG